MPPSITYNCYIDEAGDEGFRFDKGSSPWFFLTAIIVKTVDDPAVRGTVDALLQRLWLAHNQRPPTILHWRNLNHHRFVPIAVPFAAYLLDRAERRRTLRPVQWATDAVAVGLALVRAFTLVPLISGHAVFLTYALLTARSWPVRATPAAVMLQVACLKLFAWHDVTLFGGILVGCLAPLAFARSP